MNMKYEERLKKCPVAIIECSQRIPCNPCETSCPKKAISIGNDINNCPEIDYGKCTGCGICLRNCPGLAIFIVDGKDNRITIPYEFLPLPDEGDKVDALDRKGDKICEAEVKKVISFPKDKKNMITIKVPEDKLMDVRNIFVLRKNEQER